MCCSSASEMALGNRKSPSSDALTAAPPGLLTAIPSGSSYTLLALHRVHFPLHSHLFLSQQPPACRTPCKRCCHHLTAAQPCRTHNQVIPSFFFFPFPCFASSCFPPSLFGTQYDFRHGTVVTTPLVVADRQACRLFLGNMLDFPNPLSRDSLLVFSAENRHIKIAALFFFSFPFRLLLRSLLLVAFCFLLFAVACHSPPQLAFLLTHSLTHTNRTEKKKKKKKDECWSRSRMHVCCAPTSCWPHRKGCRAGLLCLPHH